MSKTHIAVFKRKFEDSYSRSFCPNLLELFLYRHEHSGKGKALLNLTFQIQQTGCPPEVLPLPEMFSSGTSELGFEAFGVAEAGSGQLSSQCDWTQWGWHVRG